MIVYYTSQAVRLTRLCTLDYVLGKVKALRARLPVTKQ